MSVHRQVQYVKVYIMACYHLIDYFEFHHFKLSSRVT